MRQMFVNIRAMFAIFCALLANIGRMFRNICPMFANIAGKLRVLGESARGAC
jgi:hypothetical protein